MNTGKFQLENTKTNSSTTAEELFDIKKMYILPTKRYFHCNNSGKWKEKNNRSCRKKTG